MRQSDKSSLEDHAHKPTNIHLRPKPKTSTNKHDVIGLSVASRILVVRTLKLTSIYCRSSILPTAGYGQVYLARTSL